MVAILISSIIAMAFCLYKCADNHSPENESQNALFLVLSVLFMMASITAIGILILDNN